MRCCFKKLKKKTPKRVYFKRPFRKQEHLLDIQNMMTEIKNSRKGLVDEVEEIPQKVKQKEKDMVNGRGKRTTTGVPTFK